MFDNDAVCTKPAFYVVSAMPDLIFIAVATIPGALYAFTPSRYVGINPVDKTDKPSLRDAIRGRC